MSDLVEDVYHQQSNTRDLQVFLEHDFVDVQGGAGPSDTQCWLDQNEAIHFYYQKV